MQNMIKTRQVITIGFILAAGILWGSGYSFGAEGAPRLTIVVHDTNGNVLSSAGQLQMRDTRDTASVFLRTARFDEQGNAVFGPEDFKDFVISGIGPNGDVQQIPYDKTVRLNEAHFQVEVTLNIDGYTPQSRTVNVPPDEEVTYSFDLE
ncbi:MAG: hypothetical protein PHN49_02315 [Candidatus Omnitrophica bacterium]|nr:hypothetical protein [Candidatus Omnitrophota bacterium]MDD5670453.1 hypothetical protein [Candidatus Omnitrophota bacterium]